VPTILTSVIAERGGLIFPHITDVFPGQEVIDRTLINTWEDSKVVDAVKATARKQLVIAGLWTEVCVAMPVIQALGEGWDVTVITDASGAFPSRLIVAPLHFFSDHSRRRLVA
jgi:isochorismate hydrolase